VKLIVGLGNPGLRYARTRHNVGFDTLDVIAARLGWRFDQRRSQALLASGVVGTEKLLLAKPQTYMNESGMSVGELVRFYKLAPATDLLVICDDLDLPLAKLRLRSRGAAGGQHGLESTIRHIATTDFARLKIGIGRPPNGRWENVDFLLSQPRGDERIALDAAIDRAADAAMAWISEGVEAASNRFNADGEGSSKKKKSSGEGSQKSTAEDAEVAEQTQRT
jgi:PTH1 family peptidyl-tRNA hydrolase